ncbi:MAG TPA: HipA family kinase [Terriglobales bacterium]
MAITAVQHVRRMRGGAQSHLMRASDGHFYVIKFQNNPQHLRVLANELFAGKLAEKIGLPVPASEVVEVSPWITENTPELGIALGGSSIQCLPGLQFGSRYVVDPLEGQVFDYLPESMLDRVRNLHEFAGMLAFDKWTGNANGRQAVFWKRGRERKYAVTFIDQGYCFNAGEWTFPDSPLRGVYARNSVYSRINGWQSFEPWLSAIESFAPRTIWEYAETIPPEWYGGDADGLEALVEQLIARRALVRDLITAFRSSSRTPFPNWAQGAAL